MLKLIKYNDGMSHADIWFWVNEEDTLASPVFEHMEEANKWATEKGLTVGEWL